MSELGFWKVSWTARDIPFSHQDCTFENFDWDREPGLKETIRDFLERLDEGDPPSLFLTGDPGNGKTHIATAAYRWAFHRYGPESAAFRNVPKFCDRVKDSYNSGKDPFRRLERANKLVVLDDIFGRKLSIHESEQILSRLIDIAYTNGAATIATTNYPLKDVASRLDPHEVSRLLQNPIHFEFESSDYRIQ